MSSLMAIAGMVYARQSAVAAAQAKLAGRLVLAC
jgi:hypothetical protein